MQVRFNVLWMTNKKEFLFMPLKLTENRAMKFVLNVLQIAAIYTMQIQPGIHGNQVIPEIADLHFKTSTDLSCMRSMVADGWPIESWITCVAQCKCGNTHNCRHVVFNAQTMTCTPVSPAKSGAGGVTLKSAEVLYSQQVPIPACNTSAGYVLHQKCGAYVCVFLSSTDASYTTAKSECSKRHGRPFVANTAERFALIGDLTTSVSENLWIGLVRVNDRFRWEMGEQLSAEQDGYLWLAKQPNNYYGIDDCVYTQLSSSVVGLNDVPCTWLRRFACEQTLF
ncbi:hepatic lectin [Plakobranchus ocellatus]|uniref:Hepatic lectin n=1 Tax=Plakobranchus ocellatus TaxID=259542 RepID=A0AAV3ZPA4_9GAST|nr:hepatic lectin [Plakobranchus ocellatus]